MSEYCWPTIKIDECDDSAVMRNTALAAGAICAACCKNTLRCDKHNCAVFCEVYIAFIRRKFNDPLYPIYGMGMAVNAAAGAHRLMVIAGLPPWMLGLMHQLSISLLTTACIMVITTMSRLVPSAVLQSETSNRLVNFMQSRAVLVFTVLPLCCPLIAFGAIGIETQESLRLAIFWPSLLSFIVHLLVLVWIYYVQVIWRATFVAYFQDQAKLRISASAARENEVIRGKLAQMLFLSWVLQTSQVQHMGVELYEVVAFAEIQTSPSYRVLLWLIHNILVPSVDVFACFGMLVMLLSASLRMRAANFAAFVGGRHLDADPILSSVSTIQITAVSSQ